jgi:hypothetical protein
MFSLCTSMYYSGVMCSVVPTLLFLSTMDYILYYWSRVTVSRHRIQEQYVLVDSSSYITIIVLGRLTDGLLCVDQYIYVRLMDVIKTNLASSRPELRYFGLFPNYNLSQQILLTTMKHKLVKSLFSSHFPILTVKTPHHVLSLSSPSY